MQQAEFSEPLNLNLPSPVKELDFPLFKEKSVRVFVKRDDLIHLYLSGNKWRKLKFNLLQAKKQQQNTLLTFGGAYSNHIHATAAAGKIFGFNTIGIIRGEPCEPLNSTLSFARDQGMQLSYVDRKTYRHKTDLGFIQQLRQQYGDFYLIPEGGSNQQALPGCAEILTELQQQISVPVDYVCMACGSGGTLAGMASIASNTQLLGYAVLKNADFLNESVNQLLNNANTGNWQIILDYHFGGYAKRNKGLMDFLTDFKHKFGIPIEPVYTAKMFYGLFDMIKTNFFPKHSTIVAIHTGGLQGFNA